MATRILRVPEHVTHRIITHTKTRHSAGGQIHQVRPVSWPILDKLEFTFKGLTRTIVDELIVIFKATAGNYITIYDEQGREWLGIVTSQEIPFTQTHRGLSTACALWSCIFQFEGLLQ